MTKELFLSLVAEYADKDTADVLEICSEAAPEDFSELVEVTTRDLEDKVLMPWAEKVREITQCSVDEVDNAIIDDNSIDIVN
jgi:hypothetical protein